MNYLTSFWILVAVIMAVVEAVTLGLVSIWFCIGAVAAAIAAVFTNSLIIQASVFVIVTGLTLAFTRPIVNRFTKQKFTATNADRIIGGDGIVTIAINPIDNTGQVKTGGQVWSAKSVNGVKIEQGTIVSILSIEGVRAVVKIKEGEN